MRDAAVTASQLIMDKKINEELVARIREFIDEEGRSCSMDIAGITPVYIQRMWAKDIPIEDIADALKEAKKRKNQYE